MYAWACGLPPQRRGTGGNPLGVSQKVLHLLVLHFPLLVITTSPGGGETGLLQTVVSFAVCSIPGRDTVAAGAAESSVVTDVGGTLQTPAGTT